MKIEVNTVDKTITIKEEINIADLIRELEKLHIDPNEYKIINSIEYPYYPYYPTYTESSNPTYNFNVMANDKV